MNRDESVRSPLLSQAQLGDDPLFNPANPMGNHATLPAEALKIAFKSVCENRHRIPEFMVHPNVVVLP